MEAVVWEIQKLSNRLDRSLVELEQGTLDINQLNEMHTQVTSIFDDIRNSGVSKSDIAELNKLGLVDIEEKYFTQTKSHIGMDVALEAEGATNWLHVVIGAVVGAIVGVLVWFVGKFLLWLFSGRKKLKGKSKELKEKTKVKLTTPVTVKGNNKVLITLPNVKAIVNLGDDYLTGSAIKDLVEVASTQLKAIEDKIKSYQSDGVMQDELDKLLGKRSLDNKDDEVAYRNSLMTSEISEELVKSTYKDLVKIMGSKLESVEVPSDISSVHAKGTPIYQLHQVARFKGSDIFASELLNETRVELNMEPDHYKTGVDESTQKDLEGRLKALDKFSKETGKLSSAKGSLKDREFADARVKGFMNGKYVKQYINHQVTYPVQYVNTLIGKVLTNLLKAHMQLTQLQAIVTSKVVSVLGTSEIQSVIKVIDKADIPEDTKTKLKGKLEDSAGKATMDAIDGVADVVSELTKLNVPEIEKSSKLYDITSGKLGMSNDDLFNLILSS